MEEKNYTNLLATLNISSAHPGSFDMTKQMLHELNIKSGSKILDVGCGTGETLAYLNQEFGTDVYGIDSSKKMLEIAQQKLKDLKLPINLVYGYVEDLPFMEQDFDYVLSESVTAFTNIDRSLKEYKRVLKNDGILVMNEMTKIDDISDEQEKEIKEFYGFNKILTENEWKELLIDAGFKQVESQPVTINMLNHRFSVELIPENMVDAEYIDLLIQHQYLTEKYLSKLGANIYIGYA